LGFNFNRLEMAAGGAVINAGILGLPAWMVNGGQLNFSQLMFLGLVSAWCFLEILCQHDQRTGFSRGVRCPALPWSIGATLLLVFWVSLIQPTGHQFAPLYLGYVAVLCMVSGIVLRIFAIRTLGPMFTDEIVLLSNHKLVTSGVYGLLRHPSEAGVLLFAIGTTVWLGSYPGLLLSLLVLAPLCAWRILIEDRLLAEYDPEGYFEYERSVPGLVPFLRRTHG
jgi:protein-S-isoprenylcysteine O-methyltransferase Ste14